MRLTLQDQYGKEAVEYVEFDQIEDGDTTHIRQFEVNAESSMYVLSRKTASTACSSSSD